MKGAYLGPKQCEIICSDPVLYDITLLNFKHGPADFDNLYTTVKKRLIDRNNLDIGEGVFRRYLENLIDGDVISCNSGMYDIKSSLAGKLIYRFRRFGKVVYKIVNFYDSLFNAFENLSSND